MKIELEGSDVRKKVVSKTGKIGHVFLPKEWIGKAVMVVLLE